MGTKSIITIISIICALALASCSTEGDVLSEMEGNNAPADNYVAAAISYSIINNGIATKASTIEEGSPEGATQGTNEAIVCNEIFFLMKGDVVLGCQTDIKGTIKTKKQDGLTILAVTNISEETRTALAVATNRSQIMAQALGDADFALLPKMGEKEVTFGMATASNTVEGKAEITLEQLTARIELTNVEMTGIAADDVRLTAVYLKNQRTEGQVSGQGTNLIANSAEQAGKGTCFYTFANNTQDVTALVLVFSVDGKKQEKEVKIKHTDGQTNVNSGYIYRLTVKTKVIGENVTPEVTFTVADWNKSEISAGMTEVK